MSPTIAFHISAGTVALLSSVAALSFSKGSRRHGLAGRVFVVAMLAMSASGAYIGFTKSQIANLLMGMLTFYLVATAWATARYQAHSIFSWGALPGGLLVGTGFAYAGWMALKSGAYGGYPAPFYFVFGAVAWLALAGDVRLLWRGPATNRIARHLWRMCFALFIAAASFFLGQQKLFPPAWRGARIWLVPPLLVLLLMVFWLIRVRVRRIPAT